LPNWRIPETAASLPSGFLKSSAAAA